MDEKRKEERGGEKKKVIQFVRGLGGVRGVGLLWSPKLIKPGRIGRQLIHISDWLPTLLTAAGGDPSNLTIDGMDIWHALSEDTESPRKMVLHNIDDIYGVAGITYGDWKFIQGKKVIVSCVIEDPRDWKIRSGLKFVRNSFPKGPLITANGTVGTVHPGESGCTTLEA